MTVRVAINGFGRVGRCFLRSAHMRDANIEVVAINDVADAGTLAALLRHDSVYGRFPEPVAVAEGALRVGESRIAIFSERRSPPAALGDLGVDVVIESTGRFRTRAGAARHLEAGARKVVISAPAKGSEPVDANVVLGVNFDQVYDHERHHIITNASCTTNCLAPVAKVLHEEIGIRHGLMTTVHAYTPTRTCSTGRTRTSAGRAPAAINLVPTSTGAAKAVGLVIPELDGRLHGYAVRVPVPTGSLVDLTVEAERPTTAEEVKAIFRQRADTASSRASSPTARSRSSPRTSSGPTTRPSSTLR